MTWWLLLILVPPCIYVLIPAVIYLCTRGKWGNCLVDAKYRQVKIGGYVAARPTRYDVWWAWWSHYAHSTDLRAWYSYEPISDSRVQQIMRAVSIPPAWFRGVVKIYEGNF